MGQIKHKTHFFILLFFFFLFVLAALEIALRIKGFSYNSPFFKEDIPFINREINRKSQIYCFDPWLLWKYCPNSEKKEWGMKINSLGFRNYEFPVKKSNNVFRIIILGDSCTAGSGVSLEETYCTQLENLLNKDTTAKHYEVINGGVSGYASFQGLRYFKIIMKKYHPDLVIVLFGANDRSYARFKDKDLTPWLILKLSVIRNIFLRFKLIQFLIKKIDKVDNIKWNIRVSPQDYKTNLLAMREISGKNKIKILFIKSCLRDEIQKDGCSKDYVPPQAYIDIFGSFKHYKDNLRSIFSDHKHFTCLGHKVIALEIYKWIRQQQFNEQ